MIELLFRSKAMFNSRRTVFVIVAFMSILLSFVYVRVLLRPSHLVLKQSLGSCRSATVWTLNKNNRWDCKYGYLLTGREVQDSCGYSGSFWTKDCCGDRELYRDGSVIEVYMNKSGVELNHKWLGTEAGTLVVIPSSGEAIQVPLPGFCRSVENPIHAIAQLGYSQYWNDEIEPRVDAQGSLDDKSHLPRSSDAPQLNRIHLDRFQDRNVCGFFCFLNIEGEQRRFLGGIISIRHQRNRQQYWKTKSEMIESVSQITFPPDEFRIDISPEGVMVNGLILEVGELCIHKRDNSLHRVDLTESEWQSLCKIGFRADWFPQSDLYRYRIHPLL